MDRTGQRHMGHLYDDYKPNMMRNRVSTHPSPLIAIVRPRMSCTPSQGRFFTLQAKGNRRVLPVRELS